MKPLPISGDRHRPAGPDPWPRRLRREERGRERRSGAAQPDARLLPQPRPRRDLHGAEARLLRGSRARRQHPTPRPIRRRRSSCSPPARPTWRSPTSRRCCWPHEQGLDVIAVAALVNRPLTSMIWLKKSGIGGIARPARQDDRDRRHPLPGRLSEDDPRPRRPDPLRRQGRQRRLRPAAGDRRRQGGGDAGRLPQRRGRRPAAARQGPGRHPGRPARRAHLRRARPRRPAPAARGGPGGDPALPRGAGPRAPRRRRRVPRLPPRRCSRRTPTSTRS